MAGTIKQLESWLYSSIDFLRISALSNTLESNKWWIVTLLAFSQGPDISSNCACGNPVELGHGKFTDESTVFWEAIDKGPRIGLEVVEYKSNWMVSCFVELTCGAVFIVHSWHLSTSLDFGR